MKIVSAMSLGKKENPQLHTNESAPSSPAHKLTSAPSLGLGAHSASSPQLVTPSSMSGFKTESPSFNVDQPDSSSGFLSQTRRFGCWISSFTIGGEKANISSKDLNAIAPTSF